MTDDITTTEPCHIARNEVDESSTARSFALPPIPPLQRRRAGYHPVAFYMAGSTALGEYCRPLALTAVKCGVTSARTIDQRLEDLRRESYAGFVMRPSAPLPRELPRGSEWFKMSVHHADLAGAALPPGVALAQGHIVLDIPDYVTVREVDDAVAALLASRSLNAFLATADGRARLAAAGRDPEERLHTRYIRIGEPRVSLATEIYLCRPRRELGKLVGALGALVARLSAR